LNTKLSTKKTVLLLAAVAAFAVMVVAAASARPAGQAGAASFTGKWAVQTNFGNTTRETDYFLTQNGTTLTGAILNGYTMTNISEGTVNGDQAAWVVMMGAGDQQRRIEYTATLNGDQLTITNSGGGFGGRGGRAPAGAGGAAPSGAAAANSAAPPAGAARGNGRGRGGPAVATRVSTDGTPHGPFDNLPKITPPPLHNVSDGGMARTPPMGWNSWNHFKALVDDPTVRGVADAIASNGMKDAGYVYVNIDDTWEGNRDASGNIQANSKFPDMKALADYVHSKGLKLGIYSSPGPRTCANYEGSYGHEQQDAKTWASWGIDYVKYDWCSARAMYQQSDEHAVYQMMGDALRASGRPIVFSLCQYGQEDVQTWGPSVGGNLWRTTGDIQDNWNSMSHIGFDLQVPLTTYAGPGHWNDPDMMEVGNGGMTTDEYKTHFSLWAILAAPLISGNDVRNLSDDTKAILLNKDVIAVDQDPMGTEGSRVSKDGDSEVWARPLAKGAYAIALFNRGSAPANISVKWSDVKLSGSLKVRDLWAHSDLGKKADGYSAQIPSHGVAMIRVER
jgi:alpha-galactosidase